MVLYRVYIETGAISTFCGNKVFFVWGQKMVFFEIFAESHFFDVFYKSVENRSPIGRCDQIWSSFVKKKTPVYGKIFLVYGKIFLE